MDITPDTKDWTWVLQRPCPECGFDSRAPSPGDVAPMLRDNSLRWVDVLDRRDVTTRPAPDVWSPLEYACHVRDVFVLFDERLLLMLDQDDPVFASWDQDATAVADRYGEQDPALVARDLRAAAERLAGDFDRLSDGHWSRTGRRSDGAAFTVESFARYLVHDVVHHMYDVTGREG
ncbi:MAG: DinB family protein [Actinomycetes bacterium]